MKMWASNINGTSDLDQSNDTASKLINVGPATPNYIDDYIGITPVLTVIGSAADGIDVPRDLDFHPVLTRNELWVILKSTENSGGKTVKFAMQDKQDKLLYCNKTEMHGTSCHCQQELHSVIMKILLRLQECMMRITEVELLSQDQHFGRATH